MPIIDLPPYGDVALFYNRDAETHVVHTWDPCPTNIHSDKFIYWVSKDNKVVEKGCWIPGKKIDDLKRGLPFTEDGITKFRFPDFWKYLQRSKSWEWKKPRTIILLKTLFDAEEDTIKIDKKSFRTMKMPTIKLDKPNIRTTKMKEPAFKWKG